MSRRRRQERLELVRRARALPDGNADRVGLTAMGFTFVASALELVVLAVFARAVRRAWRLRAGGARTMAGAARNGPLLPLVCSYAAYRAVGRFVLMRWVRRTVRRAEAEAASPA